MKKLLIVLMQFFCTQIVVHAQEIIPFAQLRSDLLEAEMKYWKMRGRLIGDDNNIDKFSGFMRVGEGQGFSLHFDRRRPASDFWEEEWTPPSTQKPNGDKCFQQFGAIDRTLPNNTLQDPRDGQNYLGVMNMGENPIINHGFYMAVLATEWALLNKDGQSTANVERELFFALKALERLDEHAETQFASTPTANGFLSRDDMHENFALQSLGKGFDLVSSNGACPATMDRPANISDKDWSTQLKTGMDCASLFKKPDHAKINLMSGDEVIGLLFGMMFIKKFVGSSATFNQEHLLTKAIGITDRVMRYTRGDLTGIGGTGTGTGTWMLKDPILKQNICRGSAAFIVSDGIAKMGQFITGQNYSNTMSNNLGRAILQAYHSWWAVAPSQTTNWAPIYISLPPGAANNLGLDPIATINFPGPFTVPLPFYRLDKFDAGTPLLFNTGNYIRMTATTGHMPFIGMSSPPKFVKRGVFNSVTSFNNFQLYDLIASTFINYTPNTSFSFWLNKFKDMKCHGSCYQIKDPTGVYGDCTYFEDDVNNIVHNWNSEFIFEGKAGKHVSPALKIDLKNKNLNQWFPDKYSEFPSVDYMIAYNLFKLKFLNGGSVDRMRRNISKDIPFVHSGKTVGVSNLPFHLKAVYSINANNKIGALGRVNFSAGTSVNFGPGYLAQAGSVVNVNIKNYDCSPNVEDGLLMGRNGNDSIPDEYFFDDVDTTMNPNLYDSTDLEDVPEVEEDDLTHCYITQIINDSIYIFPNPDCTFTDSGEVYYNGGSLNRLSKDSITLSNTKVFPNPAMQEVNVAFYLFNKSNYSINIYDNFGKIVNKLPIEKFEKVGDVNEKIDIKYLAAGLYFIELKINGTRHVYKFVRAKS